MDETTAPAEAGDGAVQDSAHTANVAQAVHAEEPPQSQEDISSPSSPNTDSQSSARSRPRSEANGGPLYPRARIRKAQEEVYGGSSTRRATSEC
jgi:hypothetical protein